MYGAGNIREAPRDTKAVPFKTLNRQRRDLLRADEETSMNYSYILRPSEEDTKNFLEMRGAINPHKPEQGFIVPLMISQVMCFFSVTASSEVSKEDGRFATEPYNNEM